MKKLLCATLLFTLSNTAMAADAPAKEALCQACHGAKGAAPIMNSYPKLNGQNKDYLISSLKDYRDGKRTGALSAVMAGQAASLSDAEIEALAAYYAAQ